MEIKVRDLGAVEEKSVAEVEQELLEKHDAEVNGETPDEPVVETVSEPTQEEAPKEKKLLKLDVDDENWDKVLKYIVANKAKGLDTIVEEIGSKYKLTASVKKAFKNAIADAK